jgi:hypothetical protein
MQGCAGKVDLRPFEPAKLGYRFDELAICVERTKRIQHFSDKARAQVQGIQSSEPTTIAEHKQLADAIRDIQSDATAAERYLRIGTGIHTQPIDY